MAAHVRILGPGDAAVFDGVDPSVFDNPLDVAATAAFLADPRHHLAAAVDGDVLVGFVSGVHYFHPDKPVPEMFVNEVGVASTHRRQGLGKRLIAAMVDHARGLGCGQAWVLTERTNAPARRLYTAAGGAESTGDEVLFEFDL
jgi:aminoglycoside 6'-N-acetyltransferase I